MLWLQYCMNTLLCSLYCASTRAWWINSCCSCMCIVFRTVVVPWWRCFLVHSSVSYAVSVLVTCRHDSMSSLDRVVSNGSDRDREDTSALGTCEASRFESAVPIRFDLKVMGRFKNFRIFHACQLLVVVKRLKPLTALSGRLVSPMGDTPVLF